MGINRVMISGNLTRDPELRSTGGGLSVLKLRMAVNDRRKNATTGEWEDAPNYVDVTIFGARADALARFLHKGSKVAVEGKLRWSEWESSAGEKRSKIEVVADELELMSARDGGAPSSGDGSAPSSGDEGPAPVADDLGGEEIPF
ncbi:MAG: single-stranded DNA-binding protein [Coriobacteriia bacterium]